MKKWFVILCLCVAAMLAAGCASAEKDLPEINFRGLKLGTTAAEVAKAMGVEQLSLNNAYPGLSYDVRDLGASTNAFWGSEEKNPYDPQIIRVHMLSGVEEVAGERCLGASLYFIKPVADGKLVEDDMDSVFFAGAYTFEPGAKKALQKKLTELYGKPQKGKHNKKEMLVWYGADQTAIYMAQDKILTNIGLTYAWLGYEDAYKAAREAVEVPPTDQSNNMSGL